MMALSILETMTNKLHQLHKSLKVLESSDDIVSFEQRIEAKDSIGQLMDEGEGYLEQEELMKAHVDRLAALVDNV